LSANNSIFPNRFYRSGIRVTGRNQNINIQLKLRFTHVTSLRTNGLDTTRCATGHGTLTRALVDLHTNLHDR